MKNVIKMSLATAIMMTAGAVSAQAADGIKIFDDLKFKGELRPRYQYTDREASTASAGSTLTNRTNLNINAGLLGVDGLRATVELNSVNDFGTLDQTTHQTAAEAAVAKVSQANIEYSDDGVKATLGRKTLNLDNQRFIGSVGWKQNFQTLDLASVSYKNESFNAIAAYVYGVNAIGDDGNGNESLVYGGGVTSGTTKSAIINASYKIAAPIKLTAYGYLLGSVSNTYGIAATGKIAASEGMKFKYRAEYAMQTDPSFETKSKGKPTNVDSTYINLDLGANFSGILAGINYEVLSANKNYATTGGPALQTNLATKHKFNGWADLFLKTPAQGLKDLNLMVGYKAKGFGVAKVIYHDFKSDEDSIDYGTELDLIYKNKLPGFQNVAGMLKAGFYSAGDTVAQGNNAGQAKDVSKIWAMLDYKFSI